MLLPQELEEELKKYEHEAAEFGCEWAENKGLLSSLKDRQKDFLAELTNDAEGKSSQEKERNARCSDEWQQFQTQLSALRTKVLDLKIKYDVSKRKWETTRSLLSSANTQRRTTI